MGSFISFVPTLPEHIDGFFELAPVSSSDVVYDLGSGDGRLLFAALEKGAGRAVGVELNSELIRTARETANSKGLDDRLTFLEADVMDVSLIEATVVLCYLSSAASGALRPKFESELKPGTKVVMESFPVIGWNAAQVTYKDYKCFYLYIMPPEITERERQSGLDSDYSDNGGDAY
jgi:SAM-dependent methyltransferase